MGVGGGVGVGAIRDGRGRRGASRENSDKTFSHFLIPEPGWSVSKSEGTGNFGECC